MSHQQPVPRPTLPQDEDALLDPRETAQVIRIEASTLADWRARPGRCRAAGGPPRHVLLGRRVFYRAGDLRAWIGAQIVETKARIATSETHDTPTVTSGRGVAGRA
jgi:hypothetical protein